jgi:hypothetical protein
MKEGLEGWRDEDNTARAALLTDLALELGRKDAVTCALAWYEALDKKGLSGEQAILLDYNWANAIAGERYGTEWKWEQPTLARELYHLRRAVSNQEFAGMSDVFRCKCLTNLGNRLHVAGRAIEALESWRRALDVNPNFGMALCNRARVLASYATATEDKGHQALLLLFAHKEASRAIASTAFYTDVRDERNRSTVRTLKVWIESVADVAGLATEVEKASALDWQDPCATEEEGAYQQWCLLNCLYLNPLNDLGRHTVATTDSAGLAAHVVRVDAPYVFESFYDQMEQEYVSARWLLYEGLNVKGPHFSDKDVPLQATEPAPSLSLAVEKVKAAYKTAYSLFDKIGFFMNAYMALGIPERQVSFRTLWRSGKNGPIRAEFDVTGSSTGNWAFCALYWLAKDLMEHVDDEVAEPEARGLSDIRNHIEHKYLRVTVAECPVAVPDDLALMVSRGQFERKATHLLRLSRSALIYLAIGVGLEERRREPSRAGVPLEQIPPSPYMSDTEKI